ncbi:hypothetical protein FA10DRAFT_64483 [Acaromyces ingoldii]|uniref:Uncharacterized protein n=1 Tax=Acaromyces ingoldii TaxID=215250 RepID=A0A316YP33_9BASI|nr:hypothetical protein FA10DRAFT_64483 [Acaromyces ingoldii]PWN91300.1 hypothetical protein FA10DRAFT_64483 [Acaromyces ingoldii]
MAIKRKVQESEEGELSRKGEAEHSASKRPRRDVPHREVKSFSQKNMTNSKSEETWSDAKRLQASGRPDFCSAKLDYQTQRQGGLPKYGPPPTSWSSSPPRQSPLHQTIEPASLRLSKPSSEFQEASWTRTYTKGSPSMSTSDYGRISATSQQRYNEGARWHHRRLSPPSLPLHQRLSPTQQRGSREAPADRENFWKRSGGMTDGSGSRSRYGDGSSGRERHEYRRARRD